MKSLITAEKRREYYLNFKKSHSNTIKDKIICPQCGGSYTYYNKSKHEITKRHTMEPMIKFYNENKNKNIL